VTVNPEQEKRCDDIVEQALELPPGDRAAFIREQSHGDEELCRAAQETLGYIPEEIPEKLGEFTVVRLIGYGGMGMVYEAMDPHIGRHVAIKVLRDWAAPEETCSRFIREARMLGRIEHPNIVKIYQCQPMGERPYFVMEYVDGEGLDEAIRNNRCGDMRAKLAIARQIAEAMTAVHRAGTLHRDIKSGNVRLDRSGRPKLLDFGIAKSGTGALTRPSLRMGTPDNLPPEVIRDEPWEERSDIYCYGLLLFELFCSVPPFSGNGLEVLDAILRRGIPVRALEDARLPSGLTRLIERAAARDIGKRAESFQEIVEALNGVSLSSDGVGVRMGRRRRALSWVAVGALTVAAGALSLPLLRSGPRVRSRTEKGTTRPRADGGISMPAASPAQSVAAPSPGSDALPPPVPSHQIEVPEPAPVVGVPQPSAPKPASKAQQTSDLVHPRQALAFSARDWILIADLENHTGEDVFNESLDEALTVGIEQSKYVNVFPHSRMPEALRLMGRDPRQKIDEKTGNELALREGIKGLLVCGIARVGDTYSLTARLVNPITQLTALTEASRASSRNDVLRALDDLATRLRKKLGESLSGMQAPNLPLPQATTPSLEALKSFAMSRHSKDTEVIGLLEQALQFDPDFAMAHADLGFHYYVAGDNARGEQHFQQALKLLNRLTVREQLWIHALVEDSRGDRDGAIARYEAFVTQYPDFDDAWFRLGWVRMITGRSEAAIDAFRRALKINPKLSSAYINIATSYHTLGKRDDAIANYQKAFALSPSQIYFPLVNHEYGFLLVEMGEVGKAEETFRMMLTRNASDKARGHRSLALLSMYQGHYTAAIPHLKEAILLEQEPYAATSELRDRLYLARVYRAKGMTTAFEEQLAAAGRVYAETPMSPGWALLLGKVYTRAGKVKEAGEVLKSAERSIDDTVASAPVNRDTRRDRAHLEVFRGEVELAGSRSAHAREVVALGYRLYADPTTVESLAHAEWELGNREEAIKRYQEILRMDHIGDEAQEEWILTHYQLAKLLQEAGNKDKARQYYEKFLTIWKDGDADMPAIVYAKAQLIRLQH
jgi:serine/threonine protein kinase/tetratricopeptide (TPR) repeat protein